MNKIFRFTLLSAVAASIAGCSASQNQAAVQQGNFATQLANMLPPGAVNNSAGQPILPSTATQAQQTNLIQALVSQQQGHLSPAQQTALQQYIAQHTQQPQQQGVFNQNVNVFNKNTAVFNTSPVFHTNPVFGGTNTAPQHHLFFGPNGFLHNLFNPAPVTTTTPTTPTNTSTALPWQNGFRAF